MPRLPRLSGPELIRILKKIGFEKKRQKGSHVFLEKYIEGKRKVLIVPNHKEIDKVTLIEIIRQAGLKRDQFMSLLKKWNHYLQRNIMNFSKTIL